MKINIFAIVTCFILVVMMFFPIATPVHASPAVMNTIQYRFFASQDSLFTALLTPVASGGVDVMGWPLTASEYNTVSSNTGIVVEPLPEAGEFEIGFNNNWTDGVHMNVRSPMNFTDFRNAMNCLVDSQGVIAGPVLGGFATRDYTQIPQPLMSGFVNPAVSGANYPWEFNVTHALQILYNGNWYSHETYPTFASLLSAYGGGTGPLSAAGGTTSGVTYPGTDQNDQGWGIIDTGPAASIYTTLGVAGNAIYALEGYYRTGDARKNLGQFFYAELTAIGCPHNDHGEATLTALRPFVIDAQTYDWATLGYSMGAPPNWFYTELTPVGIFSGGPNPYLVDDGNMTHYATAMFTDATQAQYQVDSNNVQDILVMESELVSVYTPATYCAYKTGLLGQIDELGYGTQGSGQLMNWITLDSRKNTTIVYTGPPSGTPDSNIIYYGQYNPPDMFNPIFADEVFDFQVLDEIFTYPLATNPYNDIVPGSAITGVPAGSDLPWMAYAWKTTPIPAQDGSGGQWTNVTLWFRHDITWQDGIPFTVADINYTIWANAFYGDAYTNSAFVLCTNASSNYMPYFTTWDNWTCSILVTNPSWLSLYTPLYEIIPQHLYSYIMPNNITAAEQGTSTDGLHGLWPGQAAVSGNLLEGAPFTLSQLWNDPEATLVGTGPWKYRIGSLSSIFLVSGGGITLDAYPSFFLMISPGAIAFKYTWLNTSPSAQPSYGYFKVGLSDLVYLANAYGTVGTPPSTVPISEVPGAAHSWSPAADLAAPSGVIGLSDLVTLALHYGWYYGNYGYNAPYPPSQIAGGPMPYSYVASPITIVGVVQNTTVYVTASDHTGNINIPVLYTQNGEPKNGTTPLTVTITAVTIFTLVNTNSTEGFLHWDITDPTGIGIHGNF